MATSKTDSNGYSNLGSDSERDMGAKGGPTTSLGTPDANHNISHPYSSDTQTQLAAASNKENTEEEKEEIRKQAESVK